MVIFLYLDNLKLRYTSKTVAFLLFFKLSYKAGLLSPSS